jgi:hypothetical protein
MTHFHTHIHIKHGGFKQKNNKLNLTPTSHFLTQLSLAVGRDSNRSAILGLDRLDGVCHLFFLSLSLWPTHLPPS